MSDADLAMYKRRLRQEMLARLASFSDVRATAGRALAAGLTRSESWRRADRLALFMSRRDEIDTTPLLERAFEARRPVLLPRMADESVLEFVVVPDLGGLQPGRFGILEPSREAPTSELMAGDLVLVPGLAFDAQGGRLGRGVGYYDRVFARYPNAHEGPIRIGVGFCFQLIERVPMADHDVRMDGFASESGTILFGPSGLGDARSMKRDGRSDGE
ncbi:MAG: 5-formyltetrahydrofolate cyclo-ligase [Myxococcota bacterium]